MDLLVEFFRYNTLMNLRLLEACEHLTPEQLGGSVAGTYGSVGATLVHVANAQEGYGARLLATERPDPLEEHPFPGFGPLADRFARGDAQLEQAASGADLDRDVQVTGDDPPGTFRMPVALYLLQAVTHGMEHRAQVATILTQLGVAPPRMDGWTYFFATGQMVAI